jgi:hypothetical protein
VKSEDLEAVVELLLWFGFLGIYAASDDERYSYQFQHDLKMMNAGLKQFAYCVHPSFRPNLGTAK